MDKVIDEIKIWTLWWLGLNTKLENKLRHMLCQYFHLSRGCGLALKKSRVNSIYCFSKSSHHAKEDCIVLC